MPQQLYVSATDPGPASLRLLDVLRASKINVVWHPEFPGDYETVGNDIADSDALLAILNLTWTSATHRLAEVWHAVGRSGLPGAIETIPPIPVFIYAEIPPSEIDVIPSSFETCLLDSDIQLAAATICEVLGGSVGDANQGRQ